LRIIATILVYNEADIIGQVLEHLHEHGIDFVVLDNGSTDGSIEIVRASYGRGLLEHRVVKRAFWRLDLDLDYLIEMARRYSPCWILHNDADEFLEPPDAEETLYEGICREDRCGFNVVQFDRFEFCLTEKDHNGSEVDIRKKLRYYYWRSDFVYRAWRYYPGTTHRDTAGHYPIFPTGVKARVSPRKFVMRHYPFRSPEQAIRKVFKERLPRCAPEDRALGRRQYDQYSQFKNDPRFFICNSSTLARHDEDGTWDLARRHAPLSGARSPFDIPTREELFGNWWEKAHYVPHKVLRFVRRRGARNLPPQLAFLALMHLSNALEQNRQLSSIIRQGLLWPLLSSWTAKARRGSIHAKEGL
jgi:hypothetical protein